MKKGMTRLIALMLALMLTLSAGALAAETPSNSYRVPDAQERPEAEPEDAGAEAAPEAGGAEQEPQAPAEPEEPDRVIGKKQVALNDPSDSVKIFAEASKDSAVIGNAFHGDVVEVLRVDGSWTKIRLGGTVGYIASAHLAEVGAAEEPAEPEQSTEPEVPEQPAEPTEQPAEPEVPAEPEQPAEPEAPADPEPTEEPVAPDVPVEPEASEEPAEPEEAPVESKYVVLEAADGQMTVRAAASTDSAEVAYLSHGDAVAVLGYEGNWAHIRTADGAEGYVYAKYLADAMPGAAEPEPEAEPEAEPEPEPEAPVDALAPTVPTYNYERDAEGNLVLDENGNPVAVLPEGAEIKPVAYQRDADGNLVLDENGDPIPVQFLPVDAEKVDTIQDALDPNRTIDVYATWSSDQPAEGDTMSLYAVLNGYGKVVYSLQWQYSLDGAAWEDIEEATESMYSVVVTRDNYLYYWRVEVQITDVKEDA